MSGKGSTQRPLSVPVESFDESFERIFGKRKTKSLDELIESCKEPAKSGSNLLEATKCSSTTKNYST